MGNAQLFLSAVSDEFGIYRPTLRRLFQRPNLTLHVQEDFVPTGTETLDTLDTYIKACDAVIHLVGDMTGACAEPATVETLKTRYPDLAERLPPLKATLQTGQPPLSYTQWEAYLAVYHRKILVIAKPLPGAERDPKFQIDTERQEAQQAHLERLKALGRRPQIHFMNSDQLASETSRSALIDILIRGNGGNRPPPGPSHLKIADMRTVKRWGWDEETLLKMLVDLDHQLIEKISDDAEGNAKQWSLIFRSQPNSWRLIVDTRKKSVVGYWEMHPLFPEYFEMAKSGRLVDGQLTLGMIEVFEIPGYYNVYFSMIGIKEDYRERYQNEGLYGTLVGSIFDVLYKLTGKDIFVREIAAAAWTLQGERLCKMFNLKKTGHSHVTDSDVSIYAGSISDVLNAKPARKFQDLRDRYRKEGLLD
jgi:hypothetical protein